MQTRFILGPAGSGKTFRCLTDIRKRLAESPDGPTLILIAPKQTTYQLERQLLEDRSVQGYTRLRILSFDRLARFLFEEMQMPPPRLLDEEGRLMVLRGLLARKRDELKLFRASSRLTGFAQHLSAALRELQNQQLTPDTLHALAEKSSAVAGLGAKLHDLGTMLGGYLAWLKARALEDPDQLLDLATQALRAPHPRMEIEEIWVDGFTEFTSQEMDLLGELIPLCNRSNLTFCLESVPHEEVSWLSNWALIRKTYKRCHERLLRVPGNSLKVELLPRLADEGRFADNPALEHLEAAWTEPEPRPFEGKVKWLLSSVLRVVNCASPESEAVLAAREILQFARAGGRFREVMVLTRSLESHHAALSTVFNRYEIPFFLDRRESVSHHPMADLTRNALRVVSYSWQRDDWFAALKTGLMKVEETEIDRLENEALARGWAGAMWQKPIVVKEDEPLTRWVEDLRQKLVPPFNHLQLALAQTDNRPTGNELAAALRKFWQELQVEEQLRAWSESGSEPNPIHATVWQQMETWLTNVELAFPDERMNLRDWLPVLEAALSGMTVGVIPPALDQVLIGAVDRSRNPEIRLALILGLNEGIFPAPPESSVLLTDADRVELERQGVNISNARQQLNRERFLGYVACTRARDRLVFTSSAADTSGKLQNPSPFLAHLGQLFPALRSENFPTVIDWRQSEHANELAVALLRADEPGGNTAARKLDRINDVASVVSLNERLRHLVTARDAESLAPTLATRLYGAALKTSVSRMEQFAACPFKFFVHSGLRAEERRLFELDIRDQGNFQHEALAMFHERLKKDGKRWRNITPDEARELIGKIAAGLMTSFRDGLLQANEESKFTARVMSESLQDFIETLVGWMRTQYAFDPVVVEQPFGEGEAAFPPWEIDLGEGHHLQLSGRIDRVDLCVESPGSEALCVVVDYKSSQKQLDTLLMEHGLQLQLAAYLNVLRRWKDPRQAFGVSKLVPAGVFYVNLRGKYERGEHRDEALENVEEARQRAYRHSGRFDAEVLHKLDQRPDVKQGDQFNYRLTTDGKLYANSIEALDAAKFAAMLDRVEHSLEEMGRSVYAGVAEINPYKKGSVTACDQCDYRAICRIDPWTHQYRVLRKNADEQED